MSLRNLYLAIILGISLGGFVAAQDDTAEADENSEAEPTLSVEGSLIDFQRDVWPILESKCLSCHGPEDAKNDFRVDDSETMLSYIEAGDVENTFMWTDYLVTDDPDMRMPPPNTATGDLTGAELATIRLWIEEGAKWQDPIPEDGEATETETAEDVTTQSLASRLLSFQGLFHPASVHFPIALLTISGLFVFLSFFSRDSCEPVAYHCLWIGALGAVASCVMGWGYADHEGYGAYGFDFANSSIDRHRWLGIGVAIVALVLVPMARSVRKKGDIGMRIMWFLGSLFLMAGVGIVGYQGGELTYGEDHYGQEFKRLFPEWNEAVEEAEGQGDTLDADGVESSEESEASEEDGDTSDSAVSEVEEENDLSEADGESAEAGDSLSDSEEDN